MLSKGEILGDYQILDLLGQGERGSVYLAKHMLRDRQVALKIPHHQMEEAELLKEPQIMARLKHVNIVELYTVEKKDDTFFMVLEYVDGESRVPPVGVFNFGQQVCIRSLKVQRGPKPTAILFD